MVICRVARLFQDRSLIHLGFCCHSGPSDREVRFTSDILRPYLCRLAPGSWSSAERGRKTWCDRHCEGTCRLSRCR